MLEDKKQTKDEMLQMLLKEEEQLKKRIEELEEGLYDAGMELEVRNKYD